MQRAMSIVSCLVLYVLAVSGQAAAAKCDPPCTRNGACVDSLVCYNAGKCVQDPSKPDQETCACAKGWTGSTCKVPQVICGNSTLSCMNGGQCLLDEAVNEYFCKCPPNLRGRQCQFGVNECKEGMFCMNNGRCQDEGNTCQCPSGFFGIHCQNNERDPFADLIPRKTLPTYAIALIVVAALIAVAAIGMIAFLVVRERRGRPYFKSWQEGTGSGLQGTL
ncbi:putative Neurogenic locus notch [Monoraphidium neglectum]|uniref:Putative Neurogenic locus notch n=1 Tax=Monoraphidium neglectum TaxID=145388 RepID=A0A0D2JVV6_9CHLO|nr:putative Neurogenic locus notch [Monoraphidium neglectum]KIZ02883.1 putative Neurogenic locus notch [Monoraphidium neglectum]|eukprot:XP_013901902.1 putative Neurogenic locus notch [Monoraphidium neglectum]